MLTALLAVQASSLFVFPVPDSIRWFGDESWLMTESIATVETGRVNHPHALSSTLAAPKAFLPVGAAWLRTAIYGVPGYLLYPSVNPVHVGRAVTWLISLVLIGITISIVSRRTSSLDAALIAALVLASSLSFFFSSHSARPDLLKGVIILAISAWLASEKFGSGAAFRKWALVTFASLICAIWLPFHLYFHLIAIGAIAFVLYGSYKDGHAWLGIVTGTVAALALTALVQYVFSSELLLAGPEGHKAEFNDVTRDIPILRIFSLSAQLSVLERRAGLLWQEAPIVFLLLPAILFVLWRKRREIRSSTEAKLMIFALASVAVWYFMQRIHPAYTIQMLPLMIVAGALAARTLLRRRSLQLVVVAITALLVGIGIWQALLGYANGTRWTHAGREAVEKLQARIVGDGSIKPLVMVEASATMPLLTDTSIRLMTTHFQFFPVNDESIAQTIDKHGVAYCILFNAQGYGYDRNAIDPLVHTLKAKGDLIGLESGTFFDIDKDYFTLLTREPVDTLFLYKLRK